MAHFKYAPGDQVKDLVTEKNGIVVERHERHEDAYWVRLAGGANNVCIHASNLRKL